MAALMLPGFDTTTALPWHEGERKMQGLMGTPKDQINLTSPFLTEKAANAIARFPLIGVSTLDAHGRPWVTLLGGEAGFGRVVSGSSIALRLPVDLVNDPVVNALTNGADFKGKMIAGLAFDLESRQRVKIYGRAKAGSLLPPARDGEREQLDILVDVEQSLEQCPKYLNKKHIIPHHSSAPNVASSGEEMSQEAINLLGKCDFFLVTSSHNTEDMDTNNRGGSPGFVRVISPKKLIWPEYSGNRLYQTLGNFQTTPVAGLVFPDFETGDVLYVTGRTEILIGKAAADILPRTSLAVAVAIEKAIFVKEGLFFRGIPGELSPYTPPIRKLASEQIGVPSDDGELQRVKVIFQTPITSTISRFRFQLLSSPRPKVPLHKAGQWVAFDFSKELKAEYSHMRDADPRSLNDDYVRTFTVSSHPDFSLAEPAQEGMFEVVMRRVGKVTNFLFDAKPDSNLNIGVRGFGGDFVVSGGSEDTVGFIAGGVGITPLLPALAALDMRKFRLLWSVPAQDMALVLDTLAAYPALGAVTKIFITGHAPSPDSDIHADEQIEKIRAAGAAIERRRLGEGDFKSEGIQAIQRWYICTSPGLRKILLGWLAGKEVLYENFNF